VYLNLQGKNQAIVTGLRESYNHSINGRFIQARDLFLKYQVPELGISDAGTTSAYNRALVQLGSCAFMLGEYEQAKQHLDEICSTFRLKELLC
jgi:translation initiation factor 3 subunit C